MRVRIVEIANAPDAKPPRIKVGFSGVSVHPPWASAGTAAIIANAKAVRRKVFFIGYPVSAVTLGPWAGVLY
jgi:hypothetical protein